MWRLRQSKCRKQKQSNWLVYFKLNLIILIYSQFNLLLVCQIGILYVLTRRDFEKPLSQKAVKNQRNEPIIDLP